MFKSSFPKFMLVIILSIMLKPEIVSAQVNANAIKQNVERQLREQINPSLQSLLPLVQQYNAKRFVAVLREINYNPNNPEQHNWITAQTAEREANILVNEGIQFAENKISQYLNMRLDACKAGTPVSTPVLNTVLTRTLGPTAAQDFTNFRDTLCQIAKIYAQIQQMQEQYTFYQNNGYTLMQRSVDNHRFRKKKWGKVYERHMSANARLAWYPDLQATYNDGLSMQDRLKFEANIKWSSDPWRPLGEQLKTLGQSTGDPKNICIPVPGADFLKGCFHVDSVTTQSAQIKLWAEAGWRGSNHTYNFGTVTVPAPFGYLDQLSQMKTQEMQNLKNNVTQKLASALNVDTQTAQLIIQLSQAAAGG
jgi:hypothetical protein